MTTSAEIRAWVVSAEMGYGHLRAVYPLRHIAEGDILVAGRNDGSSEEERVLWRRLLAGYSMFSRARGIPVVGKPLFGILDSLMRIPSRYPMRDLSSSTLQVELLASSIRKGLCSGILARVEQHYLPLVTSFYAPAIAADIAGHDRVYCIICDADLNRVWVARHPWESRIYYFAPCGRAAQRLKAYGVPEVRIFLTGFPLPDELLGEDLSVLKRDLGDRLNHLDPRGKFRNFHGKSVDHFLGEAGALTAPHRPLTLTYAVGGAGAQKEFGPRIARSLRKRLASGELRLNLVSGIRPEVEDYFRRQVLEIPDAAPQIRVVGAATLEDYLREFTAVIRETDILWTKPSELSFYSALGIPIIMSPTIGSQEKYNRRWLHEIQAGLRQENPDYVDQWLFDALDDGLLAEAAWSGFLKARKLGTRKILEVLASGTCQRGDSPLER
jgi:hypothetical protein